MNTSMQFIPYVRRENVRVLELMLEILTSTLDRHLLRYNIDTFSQVFPALVSMLLAPIGITCFEDKCVVAHSK